MTLFSVPAARDSRAAAILRPKDGLWTSDLGFFSPEEAEVLCLVAATLCPHEWLSVDSYRAVVLGIDRWASTAPRDGSLIRLGLSEAASWEGLAFVKLSEGNRAKALARLVGTESFALTLRLVSRYLYDLPEVWSVCGYDGSAGCSDDAPRADFDDGPLAETGR